MISELCGFMELAMGQRISRTGNDVVQDRSGNRLRRLNFAASCGNHLEYRKCLPDASRSFCGGIGTGKLGYTVTPFHDGNYVVRAESLKSGEARIVG